MNPDIESLYSSLPVGQQLPLGIHNVIINDVSKITTKRGIRCLQFTLQFVGNDCDITFKKLIKLAEDAETLQRMKREFTALGFTGGLTETMNAIQSAKGKMVEVSIREWQGRQNIFFNRVVTSGLPVADSENDVNPDDINWGF